MVVRLDGKAAKLLCTLITVVIVAAIGAISCGLPIFGDPAWKVYVHNATDVTVLVYDGARKSKTPDKRLALGEVWQTWRPSYTPPYPFKAYDENGNLAFCKVCSEDDLRHLDWLAETTKGDVPCS